ncbi:MAG TPA: SAM-dependent methyltransferase [Streptosporangiaceae bacterium]
MLRGRKRQLRGSREAARRMSGVTYDTSMAALGNRRAFLQLANQFFVQITGFAQFTGFGSALPAQGNVYQITTQYDPRAWVLYEDSDPVRRRTRWAHAGMTREARGQTQ